MGEKAKKSGEAGEKVAEKFLNLIGWSNHLDGFDIPCVKPEKHAHKEKSKRRTHGIDFLTSYRCPFFDQKIEIVPISMKYRQRYPSDTNKNLKEFLQDIAWAIECAKSSKINTLKQKQGVKKGVYTGVIIWLAYKEEINRDVIRDITDFRNMGDVKFETVYLVDNRRINFILGTLDFIQSEFKNAEFEYFYPNSGYNNSSLSKRYSGHVLPVQYINSSVLPVKIIESNREEHLVLSVIDNFDADSFKRLLWLAQDLTSSWGQRVIISFPDYHNLTHEQDVKRIKLDFSDIRFMSKVEVRKYSMGDFKKLEED